MADATAMDGLREAIDAFATPFADSSDASTTSIRLDVVASQLLQTRFAKDRVGPERIRDLSMVGLVSPTRVLREVGGSQFDEAASLADELLKIPLASVRIDLSDEQLKGLNLIRERFHRVMSDLLPVVAGGSPQP
jgi:hypothetical protein